MRLFLLAALVAAAPAAAQWLPVGGPPVGNGLQHLDAATGAVLATNSGGTFRLAGGVWTSVDAPLWEVATGGPRVLARVASGLMLSEDAGATFAPLPLTGTSLRPLAIDGAALVAHDNDSLHVSAGDGTPWRAVQDSAWVTVTFGAGSSSTFPVPLTGPVGAVVEGDALLVGGTTYVFGGVYRLAPGDTAWVPLLRPGTTDITSGVQPLSFLRHDGALWFSDVNRGVYRSTDGGARWTDASAGTPGTAGVTLHGGPFGLVASSRTGSGLAVWTGSGWAPVALPAATVRSVAVNEALHVLTVDGGFTWDGTAWTPFPPVEASSPLPLLARDGGLFAGAAGALWHTPDGGTTWTRALAAFSGLLIEHAGSLVATTGDQLTRSTDGGATWTATAQPSLPTSATFRRATSVVSRGGALVASYGYERRAKHGVLLEQYGNVFRSTNDGATWTAVTSGLPPGPAGRWPVEGLVPFDGGLLALTDGPCVWLADGASAWTARTCPPGEYRLEQRIVGERRFVRTDTGVFASTDGLTWTRVTTGLPGPAGSDTFWFTLRLTESASGLVAMGEAGGAMAAWRLSGDTWTALPWTFPTGVRWSGFLETPAGEWFGGSVGRGLWRFDGAVGTGGDPSATLALAAPAPNPSAGTVAVRWTLPVAGTAEVAVYDALGRRVAVLASGAMAAGPHDARLDGEVLAPGVYTVRLAAAGGVRTHRVVIAR